MSRVNARLLVLLFTLSAAFTTPALAHEARPLDSRPFIETCRALLTAAKQISTRKNGPLARAFFLSPRLFYNDGQQRNDAAGAFPASNEYDWHKTPWDDSPTDIVVGFGTNSVWDIASRKNAKDLIVGDHVAAPLIAQNFILRPLLRLAQTPAEFLALLGGVTIPQANRNSGLTEIADVLLQPKTVETFVSHTNDILSWMLTQDVSPYELEAVSKHYFGFIAPTSIHQFGVLRGDEIALVGALHQFYADRYFPQMRPEEGRAAALKANDSFLSSPEAFTRFKALYEKAKYAHTDYASLEFYQKLKAYGDQQGYRSYTFSLTNIIDVSSLTRSHAMQELSRYRRMIYELFPKDKYEVVIFMSTSYRDPHGFYRLERDTEIKAEDWLRHPDQEELSEYGPSESLRPAL